jgi:ER lumen protein retaining receptor
VFVARYLDMFTTWVSLYNISMKVFFIASSCYILYLMKMKFRCVVTYGWVLSAFANVRCASSPTHDPSIDTFRVEYLLGPSVILAFIFNYRFSPTEILWSFSIFLEAVAILPQLFMLQRTGEAETITTHYLAALGAYRALYIPNWIYRLVLFIRLAYGH